MTDILLVFECFETYACSTSLIYSLHRRFIRLEANIYPGGRLSQQIVGLLEMFITEINNLHEYADENTVNVVIAGFSINQSGIEFHRT